MKRALEEQTVADRVGESAHRYKSLFEQNPVLGLHSFDLEGRCIETNPAFTAITGYRSEELPDDLTELLDPSDPERVHVLFRKAAEGEPQHYKTSIRHKLGHRVELMVTYTPILVNGQIVGVQGIAQDMTERRLAERMLEESEQRYRSLFENNPDAVYALDLKGNNVDCNAVCAKMSGYTVEELCERSFVPLILPEDLRKATEHFRKAARGETQTYEVRIRHRLGHVLELRMTNIPIVVNGEIVGVYGLGKNITDSKRTEELLRKSDKLNIAGQLAAGVAHEIRNPLTALKGFVQLLQSSGTANEDYLRIMSSELDRIELIVSEFLFLAKPQVVVFEERDVREILQNVIALLDTQAVLRNVSIETDVAEEVPQIRCDENQIKQVFINVLKNAIESMQGGGKVSIAVRKDDDHLLVRFVDQGCGIPPERMPKLGEPFYTTKEKGTGVGLMVSYKIIENHHGQLRLTSEVDEGTTVEICLPI